MINPALFTSNKNDWQTPPDFFARVNREFMLTVDAAASAENAMLPRYWTAEDNALEQDWTGERVWCNPPYGTAQKAFVRRAAECQADIAVVLIPARPDTALWHDFIFPHARAEVRFLRGRLRFVGAADSAPFPSALVIYRGAECVS